MVDEKVEDRKVTTKQLAETLKLSKGSVEEMLHDMHFTRLRLALFPAYRLSGVSSTVMMF